MQAAKGQINVGFNPVLLLHDAVDINTCGFCSDTPASAVT
jgi:hypothetical protein